MKKLLNNEIPIPTKPLLTIILSLVFALATGLCGLYTFLGNGGIRIVALIFFFVMLTLTLLTSYHVNKFAKNSIQYIKKLIEDGEYYKAILDGIPFPVHATDTNMKWTFINKAFEDLLVKNGKIVDRENSYGMACSNAGANICNTEKCGIKQLSRGIHESYFDWYGSKCKQNTAQIVDKNGHALGYVETVTDLTKIIEVSDYSAAEVTRLSENLTKLAEGNLDLDLTVAEANANTKVTHDQFALISDNLAKVKNAIELMTNDAESLCEAAVEGRLSTRADASKHNGEYKAVIDGINKTLEAIVKPLDFASDYIYRLASGEHVETIDNTYKGDFAKLADSLNSVRSSIFILINESEKLAEAGINGDLTVRGSTEGIKGTFAMVVDGINNMLDAFAKPLTETIDILTKMTVNDFTVAMDTNHNGMLGTLAKSINEVRDTFHSIEDLLIRTSNGDLSRLEEFKGFPKKSENDKFRPAATAMMQAVYDLVSEANMLADSAADGNLSVRGNAAKFNGKYSYVIEGINRMIGAINEPLDNSIKILEQWATGDLSVKINTDYNGDYARMVNAMNSTAAAFSNLISSITEAATQVSSGSEEIASGSQNLSQGATEQASSLEELTASVSEIASETKENAKNAANAKNLSDDVHNEAISGNEKMKQMQNSMKDISESSANIAKIIKVIDDIAFQTNILALNAAVEAARAGQAGKGFAVVAEEVRTLAARSAKAAEETTELIENSIKKVEIGTSIANETAAALELIMSSVEKSAALVSNISEASNNQATGISQINSGLSQVSAVVQTNSATAEESAAASTELSGQAESLMTMVSQFKLSDHEINKPATTKVEQAVKKPLASAVKKPLTSTVEKLSIDLDSKGQSKYCDF